MDLFDLQIGLEAIAWMVCFLSSLHFMCGECKQYWRQSIF